jgi:hypothetical protein
MADDAMREIIDRIRSQDDAAVWNASRLAAHLTRVGLMQSSGGQFMPRRSLVGVKSPSPAPAEDMWPFLSGEP